MKEGDQSSVYLGNNFKPPDRSTSAPPVLAAESLFAFHAADHLQLFGDIRCEDNYLEFYTKYQTQGVKGLPPPLETQPFLMDNRSYREEDDHMHPSHPNSHASQQQQIHQLQQQLQQHQYQMQQQQHQQQQYPQQYPPQQQYHSQMHHPHQQHMQQQLPHPHAQPQLSQQQLLQLQQQLQQHQQQQQHQPHQQHHPQHSQYQMHPHQQHLQHMQHQQQPHRGYNAEHRLSVPEIRNPHPHSRPSSNHGGYGMRGGYDRFESVPEEPTHLPDELVRSTSPSNDTIWTPLPRKMVNMVLDDFPVASDDSHKGPMHGLPQGRMPGGGGGPGQFQGHQGPASRDSGYYPQNDFDNVAYSTASALLDDNKSNIQSLWNDRGYDRQQQQQQQRSLPHITAPTPTVASQSSLISLLGNGFFNEAPPADKMHQMNQDRNVGDVQFVSKPKGKKTIASPPPLGMGNMPPKVPSPVHRLPPGSQNGSSHMGNGSGSSQSNGNSLNNLLAAMNTLNLSSTNGVHERPIGPSGAPATSPQPIAPRSTTPNSQANASNGLDLAFASGGSTSPNGKSDLSRQYTSIEQVIGHIYSLCKDQHGCRFLQKKLEDRDPMVVEIIFNEVYDHMTELMIDPFGNYLCQKLLEHCNDEQRLHIIEKVAPDLVKISKNMHGTRAVQKMIEYLTTPEQISIAKKALSNHVVTLIQDLNGNHVIQRCLNRLSPQDNQFIYDSVSQAGHCVEVATHRHGCCVLQRCIDHASDSQKIQLINEIIANALVLVQDPYGNYVVQYVLDLPFPGLASRLARRFLGHIPILSTQKFSSNVVEKVLQATCLNVTDMQTRVSIIQELVEYDNLLYLLQDPYANYVIQTSLIVSEPVQHARLVEAIRPHLPALRNTPYGKRIQNKILKESSRDYYA